MPRRKGAYPQSRLGAFESRQIDKQNDEEDELLDTEPSTIGALDDSFFYKEEEEEETRAAKRRRRNHTNLTDTTSIPLLPLPTLQYAFASFNIPPNLQHQLSDILSPTMTVSINETNLLLTFQQNTSSSSSLTLDCFQTPPPPSQEHTTALFSLLKSQHLSLCLSPLNSKTMSIWLCLGPAALSDTTTWPDDERQRKWQQQLLLILKWQVGSDTCPGLDPDSSIIGPPPPSTSTISPIAQSRKGKEPAAAVIGVLENGDDDDEQREKEEEEEEEEEEEDSSLDVAKIYSAVKPRGDEPELVGQPPQLKPTLRHYQRRAAYWMVQRERQGGIDNDDGTSPPEVATSGGGEVLHPLWIAVPCYTSHTTTTTTSISKGEFYINPWTGRLSLSRFPPPQPVRGGILAEEMGLGKTVELLTCLMANQFQPKDDDDVIKNDNIITNRPSHERIECVCGDKSDDPTAQDGEYNGLWVQCEECNAWQHGSCVGIKKISSNKGSYRKQKKRKKHSGDDEDEGYPSFVCSSCLQQAASTVVTQDCGTTLIVCPSSILNQWYEEIQKHIVPGTLEVVIYNGQTQSIKRNNINSSSSSSGGVVTPADLAAADIVLTTYDVLRSELYRSPDTTTTTGDGGSGGANGNRQLRHAKRYAVLPTPLTRLKFWRVAADESQLIEGGSVKAAQMIRKIDSVHRWAVSGTPLSKGLDDLHGLLAFLKVEPWGSSKFWWHRCLQKPFEQGVQSAWLRLLALLHPSAGGLLWRASKADVADELDLPAQHHHQMQLHLSAIEKHFYGRQHAECVDKARKAIPGRLLNAALEEVAAELNGEGGDGGAIIIDDDGGGNGGGEGDKGKYNAAAAATTVGTVAHGNHHHHFKYDNRHLTRREERTLLHPLLRLRQAAVHPQVGGGGIQALAPQRQPMTMSEILEVLHQKAKIEAEDAQRVLLSALNGLAGLFLLEHNIPEAVRTYREVVSTIEANHEHIKADKLQQLHTFTNLATLLEGPGRNAPGIPRTLRDDQLRGKAGEIREEYLAEPLVRLNEAKGEMEESQAAEMKAIEWFQKEAAAGGGGLTGNGGRKNTDNSSSSNTLLQNWWVDTISMLTNNTFDKGEGVCKAIQNSLNYSHDEYRLLVQRNATDIGDRFRDLFGLQMLLQQNLRELETHETKALSELNRLARACENPTKQLIQMAASCGRCRPEGMSTAGNTCSHCQLDEAFLAWEVRLFEIRTISGGGGNGGGGSSQRAVVSAEEAAAAAHRASLQRVGKGGLNEDAVDHGDGDGNNNNEQQNTVTRTNITRSPSQIEQALRHLSHQLRLLKPPTPNETTHKELLLKAAKAQLDVFEAKRRQFLKARALSLAQRGKLYALDELEMCTMRLTKIPMYEPRRDGEELFKLYEEEIPVRSTELSGDKVVAKSELQQKLNTLKYLENLRKQQLHGVNPVSPLKSPSPLKTHSTNNAAQNHHHQQQQQQNQQEEEEANICPICHDPLGPQLVMLPCGHAQCIKCNNLMVSRLPSAIPAKHKKIACPICRKQTLVVEIAYVEAEGQQEEEEEIVMVDLVGDTTTATGTAVASGSGGATDKEYQQQEKGIKVKGSYGTKFEAIIRRLVNITQSDKTAKILIFSTWKDALDILSHALTANSLPYVYPRSGQRTKFENALAEFKSSSLDGDGVGDDLFHNANAQAGQPSSSSLQHQSTSSLHPRILLLMLKQGGQGLNLTEANHVVLVEPILNPAQEAQAVGRINRIGQQRETHVHRFVVGDTVEENVHALSQQRAAAMDLSAAAVKRGHGGDGMTVRDVAVLLRARQHVFVDE